MNGADLFIGLLWLLALLALTGALLVLLSRRVMRAVELQVAPFPAPEGRQVDVAVDGQRLHFHIVDRQPTDPHAANRLPVLLLHGLGGQLRHFEYGVAATLARERRVVSVDRPGSGYSTRSPGSPANLPEQARQLAALADAIDLGPAIVVGHSFGGALALAYALDHPQRVRALALVAPLTLAQHRLAPQFNVLRVRSDLLRRVLGWTRSSRSMRRRAC